MRTRLRVRPRFLLILIALMLIVIGFSFAAAQSRYKQSVEHCEALMAEKLSLTNRINSLSEQLEYVKTNEYIIRTARDELNMIMPGEIRYVSG